MYQLKGALSQQILPWLHAQAELVDISAALACRLQPPKGEQV